MGVEYGPCGQRTELRKAKQRTKIFYLSKATHDDKRPKINPPLIEQQITFSDKDLKDIHYHTTTH
jgi:hypothetical protein